MWCHVPTKVTEHVTSRSYQSYITCDITYLPTLQNLWCHVPPKLRNMWRHVAIKVTEHVTSRTTDVTEHVTSRTYRRYRTCDVTYLPTLQKMWCHVPTKVTEHMTSRTYQRYRTCGVTYLPTLLHFCVRCVFIMANTALLNALTLCRSLPAVPGSIHQLSGAGNCVSFLCCTA